MTENGRDWNDDIRYDTCAQKAIDTVQNENVCHLQNFVAVTTGGSQRIPKDWAEVVGIIVCNMECSSKKTGERKTKLLHGGEIYG